MIKLQIRDTSIKYSKAKTKKMISCDSGILSQDRMPLGLRRRGILSLLGTLYPIEHSRSLSNPYKEALAEQIRLKKMELENIIEYKTKGAIIRSKARWYNEGEKNNKYFLNLENRHCNRKTIMQIKTKDGVNITNDSDILRECNSFYNDRTLHIQNYKENRKFGSTFL